MKSFGNGLPVYAYWCIPKRPKTPKGLTKEQFARRLLADKHQEKVEKEEYKDMQTFTEASGDFLEDLL